MHLVKVLSIFLFYISISYARAWDITDFKTDALSPFTTSARNVLYVGAGLTLTVLVFEDAIVDPTQSEFVNDKPLGSFSKFGDLAGQMIPNAVYVMGQVLAGYMGDSYGYSRAIGMLKASAYSAGVTSALKYTIREPRPGKSTETNSFPSGHSTTAFAFGGYIFEEHGWKWGIPSLAIASFVGASRLNDNRHYLHDVLAGVTIGLAYGIGISKIDKMQREKGVKDAGVTIVPLFNSDIKGLALIKEF